MTKKTSSSFTICHIFALEINYSPVLLSVRALLARFAKRNKRKVVSGSRVTLPANFACKPGLSFNPLARVTLAVGLPYLLVNVRVRPHCFVLTKAWKWPISREKYLKLNRLVCKNAVALAYYGRCRLLVIVLVIDSWFRLVGRR